MSYWLEDKNGYLGDFASTMGLKDLRESKRPLLSAFVAAGGTTSQDEVRAIALLCRDDQATAYIADMLDKAQAPVIITDGCGVEDARAYDPDEPRDKTGEWTSDGDEEEEDRGNTDPRVIQDDDLPYRAKVPNVSWTKQDNQDSGKVTPASIIKDYAPGNYKAGEVVAYHGWIESSDMPSPVLVEEEDAREYEKTHHGDEGDDEDDFGPPTYSWDEYSMRNTFPPAKVLITHDGKLEILDGNHRLRFWEDAGYQYFPVWVVDARKGAQAPPEQRAFDENEPRDKDGKWTTGGGAEAATELTGEEYRKTEPHTASIRERAEAVVKRLGLSVALPPGDYIKVVNIEPRPFTLDGRQWTEAGHFDPKTGQIELNARQFDDNDLANIEWVSAHEVSHALFNDARARQSREHEEIRRLYTNERDTYLRLFKPVSGMPRPEAADELAKRFPASTLFAQTIGDPYLKPEISGLDLAKDNGFTNYTKAYWSAWKEGGYYSLPLESAINETTADAMGYLNAKRLTDAYGQEPYIGRGNETPKAPWMRLARGLIELRNKETGGKGDSSFKMKSFVPGAERAITQTTIDGKPATVAYLKDWKHVDADEATLAKAIYDDGTIRFLKPAGGTRAVRRLTMRNALLASLGVRYDEDEPRDPKGQWTSGGASERVTFVDAPGDVPPADERPGADGLRRAEEEIRHSKNEIAVAFLPDGTERFRTDGDDATISLTAGEAAIIRANAGSTLTHSHPANSSFSDPDLRAAVALNLAEVRATNPNGGVYSIRRPQGGWPTGEDRMRFNVFLDFATDQALEHEKTIMKQAMADARKNKTMVDRDMLRTKASETVNHEMALMVAKRWKLPYSYRGPKGPKAA